MIVSTKNLRHYYWNGRWKTFSCERRHCWTNGVSMIGWISSPRMHATWSRATDRRTADPTETLAIINDDMARLRGRVERLKSRHAHREFPWSRTRRFVTNVMIKDISGEEIHVNASFLVYRIRSGQVDPLIG